MRADTKKRKKATQMLRATQEQDWWADQVVHGQPGSFLQDLPVNHNADRDVHLHPQAGLELDRVDRRRPRYSCQRTGLLLSGDGREPRG